MPTGSWNLQNKKVHFKQISADDPIRQVIKEVFDMDINVSGGWGYDAQHAILIHEHTVPLKQLQHTLSSMRAHLEMSMTLPEEERYGGINLSEYSRNIGSDKTLEVVTYKVTAMLESDYAAYIKSYKEGYGTEDFDMVAHFQDREQATLRYEIAVWFKVDI